MENNIVMEKIPAEKRAALRGVFILTSEVWA